MAGLLDTRFGNIIGKDTALMLALAAEMKKANEDRADRDKWLDSLLAKDTGVLFSLYKTKAIRDKINEGEFTMSRGAQRFEGARGFAYGAAAYVSKEARRAGLELPMPTPNKDTRTSVPVLQSLFAGLDLPKIETKEEKQQRKNAEELADVASRQMSMMEE